MYCYGIFCQICIFESENLVPLDKKSEFGVNLIYFQMLEAIFPELLSVDNSIHRVICLNCRKELTEAYKFKQKCRKTLENIKNYGRSLNQKTDYMCKNNLNIFRNNRKRKLNYGYNTTTSRDILFQIKKLRFGSQVSSSNHKSICSKSSEENSIHKLASPTFTDDNETSSIYLSGIIEQKISPELKEKTDILDPEIYLEIEQFCLKIENKQMENNSSDNEDISERSSQQHYLEDSSTIEDNQQILKRSNSEETMLLLSSKTGSSNQEETLTQFSSTIENNQQILKRSISEETLVLLSSKTDASVSLLGSPNHTETVVHFSSKIEDTQQIFKLSNSEESLVLLSSTTEGSVSLLGSPNQAEIVANLSPKVKDSQQILKSSNSEESLVLLSSTTESCLSLLGSPNQAEIVANFSPKVENSQHILKSSNSEESLVLLSSTTESCPSLLRSPNQAVIVTKFSPKVEDSQQILKSSNSETNLELPSSTAEGSQNCLGSLNQAESLVHFSSKFEDNQQTSKGSNSIESLVKYFSPIGDHNQILQSSNPIGSFVHFDDNQDMLECPNQTNLVQPSSTFEDSVHVTVQDTNIFECSNSVKSLVQLSSTVLDSQNILECQEKKLVQSSSFDDSVEMMDCSEQMESLVPSSTFADNTNILVSLNALENLVQNSPRIEDSNNVLGGPNQVDNSEYLQSKIEDDSTEETHENIDGIKNILETSEERLQKYIQSNSYEFFLNETTLSTVISECPKYEQALKECSEENCDESSMSSSQIFNRFCKKEENVSRPSTRASNLSDMYESPNTSEYISDSEIDISFPDWADTEISSDKIDTKPDLIDLKSESTWGPQNVLEPSRENQTAKIEHTLDTSGAQQAPLVKPFSAEPQNVSEVSREAQTALIDACDTQQAQPVKLSSPERLPECTGSSKNVSELLRETQSAIIDTSGTQKAPSVKLPSLKPLLECTGSPQNVYELLRETQSAIIDTSGTQKAPLMKLPSPEPVSESTKGLQNVPVLLRETQTAKICNSSTQQAFSLKLPLLEPLLDSTRGSQNVPTPPFEYQTEIINLISKTSGTQQTLSMKLLPPETVSPKSTSTKDTSTIIILPEITSKRDNSPEDTLKRGTLPKENLSEISIEQTDIKPVLIDLASESTSIPQNVVEPPHKNQTAIIDLTSDTNGTQKAFSMKPGSPRSISNKDTSTKIASPEVTLKKNTSPEDTSKDDTSSKENLSEISIEKTDTKLILIDLASESTSGSQNVLEPPHENQTAIIDLTSDTSGTEHASAIKPGSPKSTAIKDTSTKITSPEDTSERDTSSKDISRDTSSRDTSPKETSGETSRDAFPKDNSNKDTSSRRTSSRNTSRDTSSTRGSKHYPDPQVCHICNKILNTPNGLQLHIYDKHTRKRLQCARCPETFKRYKSYRSHFRRVHDRMTQDSETIELRNELDSLTAADRVQYPHEQMFRTSENYSQARINNPFLMGPSALNDNRFRTAGYVPRCRNCGEMFSNHIDFKSHIFSCNIRYNEFLNFV